MACDSVITDYCKVCCVFVGFFFFFLVEHISPLLWVDNLQFKETPKPGVSVNSEKNFSSDSGRCQTLILGVSLDRMYLWKVIFAVKN